MCEAVNSFTFLQLHSLPWCSGKMTWEQVLKFANLRKRYISLYASLLKSDPTRAIVNDDKHIEELDRELDIELILQWRYTFTNLSLIVIQGHNVLFWNVALFSIIVLVEIHVLCIILGMLIFPISLFYWFSFSRLLREIMYFELCLFLFFFFFFKKNN